MSKPGMELSCFLRSPNKFYSPNFYEFQRLYWEFGRLSGGGTLHNMQLFPLPFLFLYFPFADCLGNLKFFFLLLQTAISFSFQGLVQAIQGLGVPSTTPRTSAVFSKIALSLKGTMESVVKIITFSTFVVVTIFLHDPYVLKDIISYSYIE